MTVAPVSVPPTSPDALDERAQAHLRRLAGTDARLRPDQLAAIKALVAGRERVVVVQRTGWGKSAVYWVATALRREAGAGPTLVVSPLLALMRDQVAAAGRMGLRAVTINSSNVDDWPALEAAIAADEVDVLLISPERLNAAAFRARVLARLAGRLGLLVVDEAHCVSDWGHDFRPDYRRIRDVLAGLPPGTPVLATTATANARVTADVADQLGPGTRTLRGTLDRESLALAVVRTGSAAERYAWIAAALGRLEGSGIVYTLTVAETDRLAGWLRAQGHEVAAYSGGVDTEERERIEAALKSGALKAVVATSALGMGFDMPDLGFVVHSGSPSSPIAYYQQVGRAGRALDRAVAVLLPGAEDQSIWEYFVSTAMPPPERVTEVLDALAVARDEGRALSLPDLEAATGLRRGRLEALLKVLDVDGAVERVGSGWRRTDAPWRYDVERYEALAATRRDEQAEMLAYQAETGCLMAYLRARLDDPEVAACGRCSACLGALPEGLPATADPERVATALRHLRAQEVVVEPRKMWPSGLPASAGRRGRIAPVLRAEPGRALALAGDAGWGDAVAGALTVDRPVEAEVFDGLVRVLSRWGWPAGRPTWVCPVPSRRHGVLVDDLAERLAAVGRLEVVRSLARRAQTPWQESAGNSVRSAAHALEALHVANPVPAGPALLVDDVVGSGWTLTVAAALLREAGSGPVYPLALARRP